MDGEMPNLIAKWIAAGGKTIPGKGISIHVFLMILFALTACVPNQAINQVSISHQSEVEAIVSRGTIIIATDSDYPPQSQLLKDAPRAPGTHCEQSAYSANQLSGFDIDVAVYLAAKIGAEPCFVIPPWSQIVAGNWAGVWDLSVGSMVITPDRMKNLYFSQPYTSGTAVLFVHKDNQTFHKPSDLSGKRIGVCVGCAYEDYLKGKLIIPGQKITYQIQNAEIIGYDTDTSAMADLAKGDGVQLDAVLSDPDTGKSEINRGLPIKQLSQPVYHDFVAVAVDKKSSTDPVPLIEKVTQIIQEMHRDGILLKYSQQYYGDDFTTPAARFDIQALQQFR
jgi:polar amino acid transport system substrate-binding protein